MNRDVKRFSKILNEVWNARTRRLSGVSLLDVAARWNLFPGMDMYDMCYTEQQFLELVCYGMSARYQNNYRSVADSVSPDVPVLARVRDAAMEDAQRCYDHMKAMPASLDTVTAADCVRLKQMHFFLDCVVAIETYYNIPEAMPIQSIQGYRMPLSKVEGLPVFEPLETRQK